MCVNENSRWRYCCFFLANESYSQYSVYVNYGDFAQVARPSFICIGIYVIYPLHIIIKVVVRKSEKKNEIKCSLRGHKNVMHNLMFHIQKATLYHQEFSRDDGA